METFLQQRQRVMSVGENVGLAAQILRGFREARQHLLEEELEALLGKRQQGGERDNLGLDVRVQFLKGSPGRLWHHAFTGPRRLRHLDPMLHAGIPQP